MVLFGIEKKKLILFSEYTAAWTLFSKAGNHQYKKSTVWPTESQQTKDDNQCNIRLLLILIITTVVDILHGKAVNGSMVAYSCLLCSFLNYWYKKPRLFPSNIVVYIPITVWVLFNWIRNIDSQIIGGEKFFRHCTTMCDILPQFWKLMAPTIRLNVVNKVGEFYHIERSTWYSRNSFWNCRSG